MLKIGKINTLTVVKKQGADIYLDNGVSAKVLLVDKKPPEHLELGDS